MHGIDLFGREIISHSFTKKCLKNIASSMTNNSSDFLNYILKTCTCVKLITSEHVEESFGQIFWTMYVPVYHQSTMLKSGPCLNQSPIQGCILGSFAMNFAKIGCWKLTTHFNKIKVWEGVIHLPEGWKWDPIPRILAVGAIPSTALTPPAALEKGTALANSHWICTGNISICDFWKKYNVIIFLVKSATCELA